MEKLVVARVLVDGKEVKAVMKQEVSKSQKMKDLFDLGFDIKTIATLMEVRYNFVYNVVSNYVNMNGIEVVKNKAAGKKDGIIELYLAGKSNKEISIELKTNYNYVFNVVKKYKLDNPASTIDLTKPELPRQSKPVKPTGTHTINLEKVAQ